MMGEADSPLAAVVVVTWNACDMLADCLDSLAGQTVGVLMEVVVVDNASQDGTADMVRRQYPNIRVIEVARNLGFGAAVNLGIRHTSAPFIVLLNNDAVADPAMVLRLLAPLTEPRSERIAAVTGHLVLAGAGLINSTGNFVSRTGRGYDRDWMQVDQHRPSGEVFGFCGAAVALRRQSLEEVGGFDESLFLYYEDSDLSWRLRAAGWSVWYERSAIAAHQHASSSKAGSPVFIQWTERNGMIVFARHAPAELVLAMLARRAVGLVFHTLRLGPRHPETAARWRAARQFLRRLPTTLRERRSFWREPRRSRREVARWLTPGTPDVQRGS